MEEETNNKKVAITTFDNPFNPFKDYDSWLMFDIEKGYNTNSKLARLINIQYDMSEVEQEQIIEKAIDRLIEIDPLDVYKKIEE